MDYGYVSTQIARLLDGMGEAGFTDKITREFIERIPNSRFSDPHEYHLRKLYLLHLGLGQFSLAPAKYKMFDPYAAGVLPPGYLRSHDLLIGQEDERRITGVINLPNLDLCDPFIGKEKSILLSVAIRRISGSAIQFADVTHLEWLVRHHEFVPQSWLDIFKNNGSIIFPGVKLLRDGQGESAKQTVYYPSMTGVDKRYCTKWSLTDYHVSEVADKYPSKMMKGHHFFAHFGVEEKVEAK
jgi:hypothetical protein